MRALAPDTRKPPWGIYDPGGLSSRGELGDDGGDEALAVQQQHRKDAPNGRQVSNRGAERGADHLRGDLQDGRRRSSRPARDPCG